MAASPANYTTYAEKEFISDPFFQDWVLQPTTETAAFWERFLADHPAQATAIEAAAVFLTQLRFEENTVSEERIKFLFTQHLAAVETASQKAKAPVRHLLKRAVGMAALVSGLLAGLYFLWQPSSGPSQQAVDTSYGEKKQVLLPDSSVVVLNGHSQIRYSAAWKGAIAREIWLEGEAFFDVKHLNADTAAVRPEERFIVHSKNITIEVLGTAFNIRQRRGYTEVVLARGRIKVTVNDKAHTQQIMKPGDLFSYNEAGEAVSQVVIDPKSYVAWKENKLLLVNPRLDEITRYLEDNYGKKIVIGDPALAEKKIEGPILLNNLDDALFIISTVLKTKVEKTDSLILIGKK